MNPQVLIVDDSLTVRMDLRITLGAAGKICNVPIVPTMPCAIATRCTSPMNGAA